MKILGIETSCDETAAAVLEIKNDRFKVASNIVASSVKLQAKYGGIVPEVAARKQMEYIIPVIEKALRKNNVDYIAVTNGPGLVTSLRVGAEVAKTLSFVWQKSLIEVNHMEGHIYSAELNSLKKIKFPALALLVSGGHTQLVLIKDYLRYEIIGETLDDAVGEAFDKVAKILGLGYPGGPIISKLAAKGSSEKINLPRPMINSGDYNFSFSGIKTSVLYLTKKLGKVKTEKLRNDICTEFEEACVEVLVKKTIKAAKEHKVKTVIIGGGVAANNKLRDELGNKVKEKLDKVELLVPEIKLTGDNAAMIAVAGYYRVRRKKFSDWKKIKVNPNLSL